jgi:serpin B
MKSFLLILAAALLASCATTNNMPTQPTPNPSTPTTQPAPATSTAQTATAAPDATVAPTTPTTPPIQSNQSSKPAFDRTAIAPAFVSGTNAFGFKLLSELSKKDGDKNVFISPASVALALALANNGANGETQKAIATVLGTPNLDLQQANSAYANLQGLLRNADPKVRLDIANSLWARQGFELKPDFVQRAEQFFEAQATSLNFDDPASANQINGWVRQNTQDKIPKIVEPPIPSETVVFLINAIYFKGNWAKPFEITRTQDLPFNLLGGQQKTVPMMQRNDKMDYLRGQGFQAVSLPYGDGFLSMVVVLPDEGVSLDTFRATLTSENWANWQALFAPRTGNLALPKFKLEYSTALNNALQAMGMSIAFDPQQADFSGLGQTPPNLYISAVAHKTFVEVNEEGTEAAAATSISVGITSVQPEDEPFNMIVDRPFFVAIQDNQTGAILFSGVIVEPK